MLTTRENEVMKLTAWGNGAKEIADFLHISTVTVQNHIHNIKDKLQLNKATEIAAWFFCHEFNISMELNPMKRQIGSIAMLLIIAFEICNHDTSIIRAKRCRATGRKSKTEQFEEL
jgi:DNA-binding CsgD family transcriptional regulator